MIPILIEQMTEVSPGFSQVPIIDGTKQFDHVLSRVAKSLNTFHKHQVKDSVFNNIQVGATLQYRQTHNLLCMI